MNAQPCLPQDIIEVNRNKEYTLISTDLLESVLTDTRLNAQASKLWQILFNKARYNPSFEIKISYSYLAKKLGKSTRTIARYVESLQNTGYLIVKHNFDKNGGQRPSTMSVRVPTVSIKQAKNKKDRVNKKYSSTNETLVTKNENEQASEDFMGKNPVVDAPSVLCGTIDTKNVKALNGYYSENSTNKLDVKIESGFLSNQQSFPYIVSKQDKNDMGGHDINVIQKDIHKKDINKNNNSVVPFFPEKDGITNIHNEIEILEKQLLEGEKRLMNIKDHSTLYDQIRKNSQIDATLRLTRIALERTQNEINKKTKQNQNRKNLSNPRFMLDREGERALPSFTFKRLLKSLESYGYNENALHTLINEIIFEIRFGTLVNCNKTKIPLSFDNAINIALKLVREKRWSTPVLFAVSVAQDVS